jgi:hypothetical protein
MMKQTSFCMRNFGYSLLIAGLLPSCSGFKPASNSGATGLVKLYVKGKDSLLCFAGPLKYNASGEGKLTMDYTYLKVRGNRNPVVCNFSFITKDEHFSSDTIVIQTDNGDTYSSGLTLFFAEGYGRNKFLYRYSFELPDLDFKNWMTSKEPKIFLGHRVFSGGKRYKQGARAIYRNILFDAF